MNKQIICMPMIRISHIGIIMNHSVDILPLALPSLYSALYYAIFGGPKMFQMGLKMFAKLQGTASEYSI